MTTLATSHTDKFVFRRSIFMTLGFILLLWIVKALEWSTATDLGTFGILPRTLTGFTGIITGPLIHGDMVHLMSNTFPLMLLMLAVFYFYDKIALEVFIWIYLITGFWVWLAARQAYHIGASGLVYGLASFLFFSGIFRKDVRSVAVALCIAFLYGGMLQGVFPGTQSVSWESHLLGTAAGILCAFYFRKKASLTYHQTEDEEDNKSTVEATPFAITSSTYQQDTYTTDPLFCYEYTKKKDETEEE